MTIPFPTAQTVRTAGMARTVPRLVETAHVPVTHTTVPVYAVVRTGTPPTNVMSTLVKSLYGLSLFSFVFPLVSAGVCLGWISFFRSDNHMHIIHMLCIWKQKLLDLHVGYPWSLSDFNHHKPQQEIPLRQWITRPPTNFL